MTKKVYKLTVGKDDAEEENKLTKAWCCGQGYGYDTSGHEITIESLVERSGWLYCPIHPNIWVLK